MKRRHLLSCMLALTLLLGLSACAPQTPQTNDPAAPIAEGDLKLGLLLPGARDSLYGKAHIDALEAAFESNSLSDKQLLIRDNASDAAAMESDLCALADEGCQVIFAASPLFEDVVQSLAPNYPTVQFCVVNSPKSANDTLSNTHSYYGKVEEARYLAGVLAGLKTKSNHLGYVAGLPSTDVTTSVSAYYLGAKSVNPDVELFVRYTMAQDDETAETEAVTALVQLDCDVLTHQTDTAAVALAAKAQTVFALGYDASLTDLAPKTVLSSVCIHWQLYYDTVLTCLTNGTALPQSFSEGLADEGVSLSDFNESLLPKGAIDRVEEAKTALADGSLSIFSGPLYDNKGTLVLKEGETQEASPDGLPSWKHILAGVTVLPEG